MSYPPPNWQYPQVPPPYRAPVARPVPPPAIRRAASFMYTGAALTVVGNVLSAGFSKAPGSGLASAHTASSGGLAAAVLGAAIPALLWLWMAWKTQAGRVWARVLSTVFFNIATLGIVGIVIASGASHALAVSGAGLFFTIAQWGVGLTAIILLWARDSSDYFAAMRLARAMEAYPPPPPAYGPPGYGPPGYGQQWHGQPGYGQPGYPPSRYPQPPQYGQPPR